MAAPSHFERKAAIIAAISKSRQELQELEATLGVMEEYERIMGLGIDDGKPFAELTKGDASELLLREAGSELSLKTLFDLMKARNHPVQDVEALRSLFGKDKRFYKVESGIYDLTERRQLTTPS